MWNDIIIKYIIYITTYSSIEIIIIITDIFNKFGNICVGEYMKTHSENFS